MKIQSFGCADKRVTLHSIPPGTCFTFKTACEQGTVAIMLKLEDSNGNVRKLKEYRHTQEKPTVFVNLNKNTLHVYDGGNYEVNVVNACVRYEKCK